VYSSFADAVAAVGRENPAFVRWTNLVNNAIPVGAIVVNKNATALNNTSQALFFKADKTGDFFGAQAGVSTATLQSTYLNSVVPQITTTAGLGGLTIKRGSASDTDNILIGQNGAGSTTWSVDGNGNVSTNPKITISTSVSITTATTDTAGHTQDGRHVVIDNGVNVINLTCNGGVTTSYGKTGTGAITFVQGSGRTLVTLSGTAVFNGIAGSTATLWSNGTTDYLAINNY
jgi:hypothetical protein